MLLALLLVLAGFTVFGLFGLVLIKDLQRGAVVDGRGGFIAGQLIRPPTVERNQPSL